MRCFSSWPPLAQPLIRTRPADAPTSVAEGRGRAQAESLKKSRRDVQAKQLDDVHRRNAFKTVSASVLRRDDIVHLANRFRAEASSELGTAVAGFDEDALERLRAHPWRGNVRELRNVVRQAVLGVNGGTIPRARLDSLLPPSASPERLSLPPPSRRRPTGVVRPLKRVVAEAIETAERRALEAALVATADNRTEAARLLEVDAKTLYRKLKRYGLGA